MKVRWSVSRQLLVAAIVLFVAAAAVAQFAYNEYNRTDEYSIRGQGVVPDTLGIAYSEWYKVDGWNRISVQYAFTVDDDTNRVVSCCGATKIVSSCCGAIRSLDTTICGDVRYIVDNDTTFFTGDTTGCDTVYVVGDTVCCDSTILVGDTLCCDTTYRVADSDGLRYSLKFRWSNDKVHYLDLDSTEVRTVSGRLYVDTTVVYGLTYLQIVFTPEVDSDSCEALGDVTLGIKGARR